MTTKPLTAYNYDRFDPSDYRFSNYDGPKSGEILPDLDLVSLNGNAVDLEAFKGQKLVLETGSITCPMYVKNIRKMNALAKANTDVAFIVIYVREAHPGEKLRGHSSLEQKLHCARRLHECEPEHRKVFVDGLEGDTHAQLGLLPNLLYLVNESGRVVLRSSWNNPELVEKFLAGTLNDTERARESIDPAKPNPYTMLRVTLRGGFLGFWDLIKSIPKLVLMHSQQHKH